MKNKYQDFYRTHKKGIMISLLAFLILDISLVLLFNLLPNKALNDVIWHQANSLNDGEYYLITNNEKEFTYLSASQKATSGVRINANVSANTKSIKKEEVWKFQNTPNGWNIYCQFYDQNSQQEVIHYLGSRLIQQTMTIYISEIPSFWHIEKQENNNSWCIQNDLGYNLSSSVGYGNYWTLDKNDSTNIQLYQFYKLK